MYGFFDSRDLYSSTSTQVVKNQLSQFCLIGTNNTLCLLDLRDWSPVDGLEGRISNITPDNWNKVVGSSREVYHRCPLELSFLYIDQSRTRLETYSLTVESFGNLLSGGAKSSNSSAQKGGMGAPSQPPRLVQTRTLDLGSSDTILYSNFGMWTSPSIWWVDPDQNKLVLQTESTHEQERELYLDPWPNGTLQLSSLCGGRYSILHSESPRIYRIFCLSRTKDIVEIFGIDAEKSHLPVKLSETGHLFMIKRKEI